MKSIRSFLIGMVISGSLATSLYFLHAQETAIPVQSAPDSIVQLTADSLGLPLISPEALPASGTFFLMVPGPNGIMALPYPCPPGGPALPTYSIIGGVFLVDGTGGQVLSNNRLAANGTVNSALAAQAAGVVNLVDQVQGAAVLARPPMRMAGGMMMADSSEYIGGISNVDIPAFLTPQIFTTNDLYLQMDGITNTTAYLMIHPPWTVTNEVYDLYYTTNLTAPATWSWVMRSFAGLTNLTVNNATDAQGFYRLGPLNDPIGNSSQGTNFWVAFMTMDPFSAGLRLNQRNRELWLYISSPVGASGTVTYFTSVFINNDAWTNVLITTNFTVAAGAVANISITNTAMMGEYLPLNGYFNSYGLLVGVVQSNCIHVAASQPVSVYALYYQPASSTAFTCYPTTLLGTNYCLMARPSYYGGDSQFAIVATADSTTVNITPSPLADLMDGNGNVYTNYSITLQQGQAYQIQSSDYDAVYTDSGIEGVLTDDVTGTWISSDKPVAVFAGASTAAMPDTNTPDLNPLAQEQLPVDSWGTAALSLSFAGRMNGDNYRILAAYSNTVVTISGTVVTITNEPGVGPWQVTSTNEVVVTNLDAGQFCDFIIDGPAVFQATKPIQVAQFANGADFDLATDPAGHQVGDPCEILLQPTGHWLETNIVFTPLYNTNSTGDIVENFLNIIVAQSAISSTFVDTNLVAATNFVAIGSSGYYGAQLPVTNGTHTVTSSRPVGVEVYGFGFYEAYGYFGGVVK